MLGLGSSLLHSGSIADTLLFSYTSDFTSSIDSFIAQSIEDSASDLTLTYNETISGSDGWLKGVFAEDQASPGGIKWHDGTVAMFPDNGLTGDYFTYSYKIYLHDTSTWGSDDVRTSLNVLNIHHYDQITPEGVVNVSGTSTFSGDDYDRNGPMFIWNLVDDQPSAGAVFYIKDVRVDLYRPY